MNNKLQLYFDYFDKYHGVENWIWYKSLTKWVNVAQKIKSKVSETEFDELDTTQTKSQIEKILIECSNGEIKVLQY